MNDRVKQIFDRMDKLQKDAKKIANSEFEQEHMPLILGKSYIIKEVTPLSEKGNNVKNTKHATCVHFSLYSNKLKNSTEYYVASPNELEDMIQDCKVNCFSELRGEEVMLFKNTRSNAKLGLKYSPQKNRELISAYIQTLSREEIIKNNLTYSELVDVKEIIPCNGNKVPVKNIKSAKFVALKYEDCSYVFPKKDIITEYIPLAQFENNFGKLSEETCSCEKSKRCIINRITKTKEISDVNLLDGIWK